MSICTYGGPCDVSNNMHGVPRFTGENNFNLDNTDYILGVGLIIVPWAAVGVAVALIMLIVYVCPCVRCCTLGKRRKGGEAAESGALLRVLWFLAIVLALGGTALALAGFILLSETLNNAKDSALTLIFDPLDRGLEICQASQVLVSNTSSLIERFQSQCPSVVGSNILLTNLVEADSALQSLSSELSDLSKTSKDVEDLANLITLILSVVGIVLTGMTVLVTAFLAVGSALSISNLVSSDAFLGFMRCFILIFGILCIILLWGLTGFGMAGNCLAADFCQDPDNNIIDAFINEGANSDTLEAVQFYISCQGDNPFASQFQTLNRTVTASIVLLNIMQIQATQLCPVGLPLLTAALQNFFGLRDQVNQLEALLQCETFHDPYCELTYQDTCSCNSTTTLLISTLILWIGCLVAAFFFGLLVWWYDPVNGRVPNCCCRCCQHDD